MRAALVLVGLTVLTVTAFSLAPLDLSAARLFYAANAADHWPLAQRLPWWLLYAAAPCITASLVVGSGALLVCGWIRAQPRWRRYGAFVLLSLILGPGLLVNAVLKDHWERPRPRDVVAFGGPMPYVPAPLTGPGGGSFPCGHCSVGFLYGLGFWVWRRRRPRWAWVSLAAGLATGTALGLGRMAAGAHFLSDVVWSALLAFAIAELIYRLLRIAEHEAQAGSPPRDAPAFDPVALLSAGGGIIVLGALFLAPHGHAVSQRFCVTSAQPIRELVITAQASDVQLVLDGPPADRSPCISASGELHGFGAPGSALASGFELERDTLYYRIEQRGWITDLSALIQLHVPRLAVMRISVRLQRGNITVAHPDSVPATAEPDVALDLRTLSGAIRR